MTGPLTTNEQELFRYICGVLNNTSTQTVGNVSLNLLVNAILQSSVTRRDAERLIDDLFARAKTQLLGEYDAVSGKKRSVIKVEVPFHVEQNRVG